MTPSPASRGGRQAAAVLLAAIDPVRYGATRNHLDGAVTRLSPYIRHGVVSLAEVRDLVFSRLRDLAAGEAVRQGELLPAAAGTSGWSPAQRRAGEKLIAELGWRDYWQRLWWQLGDGIWLDREPLKTGHPPEAYAAELPADLGAASTGLACIDAFATQLMQSGWLHNHARMWLAAYVVHWRRVRWQAGARWFLQHLLDGDPASNNLSWQWVASTFSHKPYIFNRANLERFSSGRFCAACPAASRGGAGSSGGCPFEASYELLQSRLFRPDPASADPAPLPQPSRSRRRAAAGGAVADRAIADAAVAQGPVWAQRPVQAAAAAQQGGRALDDLGHPGVPATTAGGVMLRRPLVWVHGEALGTANPALRAHPDATAVFVFDSELLAGRCPSSGGHPAVGGAAQPLAPGRLRFLRQCLEDLPVLVRQGDVAAELLAMATASGADGIVTSRAVDPRFAAIAARLTPQLPLHILEPQPFVDLPWQGSGAPDLRRFSRYWRRAEPLVWEAAPAPT